MCSICEHVNRGEIEAAVLNGVPYIDIATDFNLDVGDIKLHCLTHLRIGEIAEEESKALKKVKSKELLLLQQSAFSYFLTLKSLERVIQSKINEPAFNSRSISKSLVDLYLGSGNTMRQMIDSLFNNMNILTGDNNQGMNALADLVAAIQKSKEKEKENEKK